MTYLNRFLIITFIFLSLISAPYAAKSESVNPQPSLQPAQRCADKHVLEQTLVNKIEYFVHQKFLLEALIKGEFTDTFDASTLLDVNLDNPQDFSKKIDELKKKLQLEDYFDDREFKACISEATHLHGQLNQFKILKREFIEKKIEFLILPVESKTLLLNALNDYKKQRLIAQELEEKKQAALLVQQEAERQSIAAEAQIVQQQNDDLKLLASARAQLEERKLQISNFHLKWVADAEARFNIVNDSAKKLAELSARLNTLNEFIEIHNALEECSALWRELSSRIYNFYNRGQVIFNIPELPAIPTSLLNKYSGNSLVVDFKNSSSEGITQRNKVIENLNLYVKKENENDFRLLLNISRLRSKFLAKIDKFDQYKVTYSKHYFLDLANEVKVIPYRALAFFHSKALEFQHYAKSGLDGYISIGNQLFFVFLLAALPILIWISLKKMLASIDSFRVWLVKTHARNSMARSVAIWIPKISYYLPWLLIIIIVNLLQSWIANTAYSDVLFLLPYVLYYAYYRILRELVKLLFIFIANQARLQSYNLIKRKIESSSRRIGLLFFVTFVILYSIKSIVSEGYLYHHVVELAIASWILIVAWVFANWRVEIKRGLETNTSSRLADFIAGNLSGTKAYILSFTGAGLLIIRQLFVMLLEQLSEFNIAKKIEARIFRRQVEKESRDSLDHGDYELPQNYLSLFSSDVPSDSDLLITPKKSPIANLMREIIEWEKDQSDENSMVIYGDTGSGKSCVLRQLESELEKKELTIINVCVPPKLTNEKSVYDFIFQLFGLELGSDRRAIAEYDKSISKTVLLLDDCQNLFLSQVGAFDGFKLFLEIINMRLDNLFWCLTFNSHSWRYLHDVFGRHRFFRIVTQLEQWDEDSIRDMVMHRHQRSDYVLSYDRIIAASKSSTSEQDFKQIEDKFFTLLWEQSSGNPRTALYYWLLSLKPMKNKKLRVGLPETFDMQIVSELHDDLLFIYAAIVRHENLTSNEAAQVTNLSYTMVRHALKIGLERGFLNRSDDRRFRLAPEMQELLLRYLTTKNFIHGY